MLHQPEEQHDGKRLVGWRRKHHTQLDGLLQVLLGNVEAVIVDLAVQEDKVPHRTLLQHRSVRMLLQLLVQKRSPLELTCLKIIY